MQASIHYARALILGHSRARKHHATGLVSVQDKARQLAADREKASAQRLKSWLRAAQQTELFMD